MPIAIQWQFKNASGVKTCATLDLATTFVIGMLDRCPSASFIRVA